MKQFFYLRRLVVPPWGTADFARKVGGDSLAGRD